MNVSPPGFILWFTGMSGAGKSTLSAAVQAALHGQRKLEVLDGDEVREHLSKGLGFTRADRDINVRRIGFVARLLARNGVAVATAAISPYAATRTEVRAEAVADGIAFVEIYMHAALATLARRDVKGLYQRALAGDIPNFTGISDPYEAPTAPDLIVTTDAADIDIGVAQIIGLLRARGLLAPAA